MSGSVVVSNSHATCRTDFTVSKLFHRTGVKMNKTIKYIEAL